jgi:hypothetical protein
MKVSKFQVEFNKKYYDNLTYSSYFIPPNENVFSIRMIQRNVVLNRLRVSILIRFYNFFRININFAGTINSRSWKI